MASLRSIVREEAERTGYIHTIGGGVQCTLIRLQELFSCYSVMMVALCFSSLDYQCSPYVFMCSIMQCRDGNVSCLKLMPVIEIHVIHVLVS